MSPAVPSIDIDLWSKQTDFVIDPAKALLFVAGIGSGKTVTGAVRALNATQGYVGDQPVIPVPNWGMITAPTYSMLEDGPIPTFLDLAAPLIDDYNDSKKRVRMANGSTVLFRSTEKIDRRRGSNLSWWWGDESAMYRESVWSTMIGRLRENNILGYLWLTTSPKGRDWLWQKFERNKSANFRMIRAATWENPFISDDYIKFLIGEYGGLDSDFARQEILGQFIAHSGLIYNMFGDRHITRSVLDYYPQVEAGVDWGFRNPGVIEVGGIDVDGGIDILHEEYKKQRDIDGWIETALDLRDRYLITRFWCDPSRPDYIKDFRAAGLNAVAADNRVLPGIKAVKRILSRRGPGGLRIHESCVWLIKEMRDLYQWAKERGLIMPEEPLKVHDHACLVAGTMISTSGGLVPIEQIREGNMVETRDGFKPVITAGMTCASAQTLTVELSNGQTLRGTANHPVWVKDTGFVLLGALAEGDILTSSHNAKRQNEQWHAGTPLHSTASNSTATLTQKHGQSEATIRPTLLTDGKVWAACIRRYGKRRMVLFLKGMKSTIGTAIRLTTPSKTLNVCLSANTGVTMQPICQTNDGRRCVMFWLNTRSPRPQNGTPAKRDELGIANMAARHGKIVSRLRSFAITAASRMRRLHGMATCASAQTTAKPTGDASPALTTWTGYANAAERLSESTATPPNASAPVRVVRVTTNESPEPVYNLTVAETPEYFANGVLVHNCDALRYLVMGAGQPASQGSMTLETPHAA